MNGNKIYEINIDVDLYRKITNSLNNIIGDLNRTLSKAKINPFSGELLTYYNNLENDISIRLESIISEIDELGLKIDTSINTYQNIDEELRFGLDSIVDKIFEVGNGGGISIEFDGLSTYQERKEYLEKLIESYTTTLEELKKEYNNLYGNGIVIEYHEQFQNWFTIVTSLGGVNNFNSGLGNIYNQNGNLDIDNLSIILNFYKENNINVKLKNYIIDGKSWSDSGLSSFNDNELTDNENEFNFLYSIYDSFGISSNEYVENIFFDGYDSYNEENINTAKSFLSQKMDFNLFGKLNETYTDCITKQADIINLQSAIYNYEQYQKLMPFEEARRNIDYLDYISKDYSNYDNDILNGNMYGGKYKDYLNYMDQSEVALYDYIYTKQGSDIAETYLFALTDTINQRKGFEKASNYVSNLNQNGLDAGDFFASGWEGFKDGNITFFNGISNFFTADGIVSDFDYEMLYKMQLLSSDEYKNYTNNLSDEAKKFLSYNYQINNSIGNMTIPMLVSFVPVVGKSASSALMWTSSTGNATEQAMQGGASKSTAYLYGGLSGLSEVAFEKVMGGIPGLSDGVGVGVKGIFKDMISEGNEEYLQTWVDALLRSTVLGEKIDVSSVSGEAMESFGMGMAVSGQMKVGMAGPAKIIDVGVSKMTNGVFNDYNSYKLNTELELSNDAIDVTESIVNNEGLYNMPDLQNVTNVTFDPNSGMYRAQFSDGKIRFVNNDSSTSPNNLFNFTFNFNDVQEKIKNTTGAILTKVGEVGNLLKGFVLNTAMAEEDIDIIDDINVEETIVNINTENNTADLSNPVINFKIDFASIKEKIRNTTGVILTKVGEVGNLLKGFVIKSDSKINESLQEMVAEVQTNEITNKIDVDISNGLDINTPSQYSDYSLRQIIEPPRIKDIFNKFFELATDDKIKSKLQEILYNGGVDGFGFSTHLLNQDNPFIEAQRRIAMANLYITQPDTFNTLVENKINIFHGTSSSILSSILQHGLKSGLELQQSGINVTTGESWSRIGGEQRNVISLTDLLGLAKFYSEYSAIESKLDSSFGIVVATTVEDVMQEKIVRIPSDPPELDIESKLPVEKIKAILVPYDKIEIVKNMMQNSNIQVLAINNNTESFYYIDYDGVIEIYDDKFNELKNMLSQRANEIKNNNKAEQTINEQETLIPDSSMNKTNEVSEKITEINNILSTILPANYYHGDIAISKMFNKTYYNIPIIYSESSIDYSIIDLYPTNYYIRVSIDGGNIEQQIRTQLESIVSKNTKINENIEQANTVDDTISEKLVIKTSNGGLSEFTIDEKQGNVSIEQNDKDLIDVESLLKKVRINPYSLKDISEKILMKHPEIVLEAIKPYQSGSFIELIDINNVIKCVSENVLLAHSEIVREALNQDHMLIANLSEKVQFAHSNIILDFIKQYNGMIRYVNEEVLLNHREIVEEALKKYSSVLSGISEKVQLKYANLVMDVVKRDPKALAYVSEKVKLVNSQKLIKIVKENYGDNIIGFLLQASLTKNVHEAMRLLRMVETFFEDPEVWKTNLELSKEVVSLYREVKSNLNSKQFFGSTVFDGIVFNLYGESKIILAHNASKVRKVLEVLPDYLKKYFPSTINIYDSENPDDLYWTVQYNWPTRFSSAATAGNNEIDIYKHSYSKLASTLVHEIGHLIDEKNGRLSESNIWKNAVDSDFNISGKRSVTDYGKCSIREDFADSVKLYWQKGDAFRKEFPNRAKVLDDILLK